MLLVAHNKNWANDFAALQQVLVDAMPHCSVSIEHVGGTAIPQLACKPIIDIDIVIHKQEAWGAIKNSLEQLGYYHNGNQGIADREVFKRRNAGAKHGVLDGIVHHLYVCPSHSLALQEHLLFRDYLRAHEAARLQYQELKQTIATAAHQDKKKYAQLKEQMAKGFVQEVLAKARAGAAWTNDI